MYILMQFTFIVIPWASYTTDTTLTKFEGLHFWPVKTSVTDIFVSQKKIGSSHLKTASQCNTPLQRLNQ